MNSWSSETCDLPEPLPPV